MADEADKTILLVEVDTAKLVRELAEVIPRMVGDEIERRMKACEGSGTPLHRDTANG